MEILGQIYIFYTIKLKILSDTLHAKYIQFSRAIIHLQVATIFWRHLNSASVVVAGFFMTFRIDLVLKINWLHKAFRRSN